VRVRIVAAVVWLASFGFILGVGPSHAASDVTLSGPIGLQTYYNPDTNSYFSVGVAGESFGNELGCGGTPGTPYSGICINPVTELDGILNGINVRMAARPGLGLVASSCPTWAQPTGGVQINNWALIFTQTGIPTGNQGPPQQFGIASVAFIRCPEATKDTTHVI